MKKIITILAILVSIAAKAQTVHIDTINNRSFVNATLTSEVNGITCPMPCIVVVYGAFDNWVTSSAIVYKIYTITGVLFSDGNLIIDANSKPFNYKNWDGNDPKQIYIFLQSNIAGITLTWQP